MQSGYKTITPIQLANALSALQRGEINHNSVRVYVACFAMVAIREAAARHASKRRRPTQTIPCFKWNELGRLTGLATAVSAKRPEPLVNPDKDVSIFAPLPTENCTKFAPPYKNKKTSYESKNQKAQGANAPCSGVYLKGVGEELPAATLNQIRSEDFYRLSRMEELYFQAIDRGWVKPCEASALNFISAAVRAREVGSDPARVFVTLVRRGLWQHITQAQEDHARAALMRYRSEEQDRFRARHSVAIAA